MILRGSGLGYEVVAERENESFHEKKFLVMGRGGGCAGHLQKLINKCMVFG
jgi:hypothetical protein